MSREPSDRMKDLVYYAQKDEYGVDDLWDAIAELEASQLKPGFVAVREERLRLVIENRCSCIQNKSHYGDEALPDVAKISLGVCKVCITAWLQDTDQQQPESREEGGGRKI